MAKATYRGPAEALERYDAAVALAGLERKGASTPYTSGGGHMTSFLDPSGTVALRMPAALREEFAPGGAELVEQHGTALKEFVAVPASLLSDTEALALWLRRCAAAAG